MIALVAQLIYFKPLNKEIPMTSVHETHRILIQSPQPRPNPTELPDGIPVRNHDDVIKEIEAYPLNCIQVLLDLLVSDLNYLVQYPTLRAMSAQREQGVSGNGLYRPHIEDPKYYESELIDLIEQTMKMYLGPLERALVKADSWVCEEKNRRPAIRLLDDANKSMKSLAACRLVAWENDLPVIEGLDDVTEEWVIFDERFDRVNELLRENGQDMSMQTPGLSPTADLLYRQTSEEWRTGPKICDLAGQGYHGGSKRHLDVLVERQLLEKSKGRGFRRPQMRTQF